MKKGVLLIAEDEKELRDVISDLLADITEDIILAENGEVALNICKTQKIDAVLTDINMPKKTGLQFLRDLRMEGIETPVVILTGYGDKAKATEALRLGAMDFMDKPFEDKKLIETMTHAIGYGLALREFEEKFASSVSEIQNSASGNGESKTENSNAQMLKAARKQIWMMRYEKSNIKN